MLVIASWYQVAVTTQSKCVYRDWTSYHSHDINPILTLQPDGPISSNSTLTMGLFHDIYESVELGHFNWPFRNR